MPEITWDMIIDNLKESDKHLERFEINEDGEILCKTEEDANCLADFIECLLDDVVCTSFYESDHKWSDAFRWELHLNGM